MSEKNGVAGKVKNALGGVKRHWKTAPDGRYVPYSEIAAYSFGGIGSKFLINTVWTISLSGTSLLAGSALNLEVGDLTRLNIIAMVFNYVLNTLRGYIIDNTHSSKGKFRPYLLYMGVPSAFLVTVFAFLPFETMSYSAKLYSLFAIYMLLQVTNPFYDQAYTTLVQVMSPNSTERADIITFSTFVNSLAPSITGFAFPAIGGFFGGLDHIGAYRIILPLFAISGALIGLVTYFGTRERIIVAKDYVPKVPFFKGLMLGATNKYQWARSIQSWCVYLQCGIGNVTTWYFFYGIKDILNLSDEQQGVYNGILITVLSMASNPAMLAFPFLVRKMGKRNLVIFYTVGTVAALFGMLFSLRSIWLLFAFIFIRGFFNTFPILLDGAINADVLDYQQYKSGHRLEGMMGQLVGYIGSAVTIGITYLVNTVIIQNHYGLVANYNDLYNQSFREPISRGMIILTIVGYALSLIPFVTMYDLTEEDHEAHISVLKIRAALEDYATNNLSEGQLEEVVGIYSSAEAELEKNREMLSAAKTGKEKRRLRKKVKALTLVVEEKNRFETEKMKKEIEKAGELLSHTVEELYSVSEPTLDAYNAANAMPETTKEERKAKAAALKSASKELDFFHKKAYDYIKARTLMKQYEYYLNWNEIFEMQH